MSKSVLEKLKKFLSRDERERVKKRAKLVKILKKMRKKQKEAESELADCHDPQLASELRTKIRVLQEQRRKGLEVLQELHRLAGESLDGS